MLRQLKLLAFCFATIVSSPLSYAVAFVIVYYLNPIRPQKCRCADRKRYQIL